MRASISSFLAFRASSIAFLASVLATGCGFTAFTSDVPTVLARSTSAFVVALSISCFTADAFSLTSALAAIFSSSVKSVRASISSFLAFNSSSTAFLASVFATASGFTEVTSDVP